MEHWLMTLLVIATLIGPLAAAYFTQKYEQRFLTAPSADARALISDSVWNGVARLELGPEKYRGEYSVHLQLKLKRGKKVLSGTYVYQIDSKNPNAPREKTPRAEMTARGGFNTDRFLTLRLRSCDPDPNNVHFGIQLFNLSTNKHEMTGIWMAFGLHAGEFIGGTIHLEKI